MPLHLCCTFFIHSVCALYSKLLEAIYENSILWQQYISRFSVLSDQFQVKKHSRNYMTSAYYHKQEDIIFYGNQQHVTDVVNRACIESEIWLKEFPQCLRSILYIFRSRLVYIYPGIILQYTRFQQQQNNSFRVYFVILKKWKQL